MFYGIVSILHFIHFFFFNPLENQYKMEKKQGNWGKEDLKIFCQRREAPSASHKALSYSSQWVFSMYLFTSETWPITCFPLLCTGTILIIDIFVIVKLSRNTSADMHWFTFGLHVCDSGDCQLQSAMRGSYCPSSK